MTPDKVPACRCVGHPPGYDKRKYMRAVEENADYVVWCCTLCTELERTPVIQVATLPRGKAAARYQVAQQRRSMDPRLLRMLQSRKRAGATIKEAPPDAHNNC
jgi:hypothetical protein